MRYLLIFALFISSTLAVGCASQDTTPTSTRRFIIQLHNPTQQATQGEKLSRIAGCDLYWLRMLGTGAGLWQTTGQCTQSNAILLKNLSESPLVVYAELDKKVALPTP